MGTGSKRGYTDIDLVVAKQFSEYFRNSISRAKM